MHPPGYDGDARDAPRQTVGAHHDWPQQSPFRHSRWHFIEWANLDRRGESAAINALYAGVLEAAGRLAEITNRPTLAECCAAYRGCGALYVWRDSAAATTLR
jgi:hypothetical protein